MILKDILVQNKMNFQSNLKLNDPKICKLLHKHVPGSYGTQIYLKITNYVIMSHLALDLNVGGCIVYAMFRGCMFRGCIVYGTALLFFDIEEIE